MKFDRPLIACVFIAAAFLTGCSTIINGTTQDVSVSSDPPGAAVTADGNNIGVTPLVLDLKRKDNHIITVSMPGYHTEQVSVTKVLSGAVAGNIIAGGLIGWGVDAASGAQYKLKPDTIAVQLRPRGPGEADFGLAAAWSPADQLRQLDQLRREGIITETEFEATKQELLAAMKAKAPAPPSAPFSTARTPAPPSPQTTSTETTAIPESTPAAHPSWITAPVSKP